VVVILEPKSVEGATYRLQVYVTEKVLARLGQLGIENLHTHLYDKVVRVSGSVKRVDYDKGGGYCHLVVENLDQFELIGAQPGSGTTPLENPVPPVTPCLARAPPRALGPQCQRGGST
jgi:hypothetical protein